MAYFVRTMVAVRVHKGMVIHKPFNFIAVDKSLRSRKRVVLAHGTECFSGVRACSRVEEVVLSFLVKRRQALLLQKPDNSRTRRASIVGSIE